MVIPNINTDAINTSSIIDIKIRDRKDIFLNKAGAFRSKLANIEPKFAIGFTPCAIGLGKLLLSATVSVF